MNKFNRKYLMAIQYGETKTTKKETDESGKEVERIEYIQGDQELIIRPFFTINFTIDRGIYASVNKMTMDIYNLSKETREKIYYDGILHAAVEKKIVLYAGYSNADFSRFNEPVLTTKNVRSSINGVPLVFYGRFTRAYSYRDGSNFITHIEAFDLPQKNEVKINTEFDAGTTQDEVLSFLANKLDLNESNICIDPDFKFRLGRKKTFNNMTSWEAVQTLVNSVNDQIKRNEGDNAPLFRLYYDYPNLAILRDDHYFENEYVYISAETGLLSTPIRESSKITFKTLFEPTFRAGGYVKLNSRTTQTGINGILKIVGFKHTGVISPVVSGTLTTDFTCFLGIDKLSPVRKN